MEGGFPLEELRQRYQKAATEDERRLILESMQKFPSFSEETVALIEGAAKEYLRKESS